MDQRLSKIENKVDAIDEKVNQLVVTTATNSAILEEHMRRSDALEKRNDLLEQSLILHRDELQKELAPIKIIIDRVKFSAVLLTTIISIVATLKHLGLF